MNWNNYRVYSNNNVGAASDYGSFLKSYIENSGTTGMCYPALSEINVMRSF